MAVVKEFNIGATRIRIHDDYVVQTQEEVDGILRRCGEIYHQYLLRKEIEKRNEQSESPQN